MNERKKKHNILILGASGFIGNTIYKELCSYFNTFGTYNTCSALKNNRHFFKYNVENDDIFKLLETVKPSTIISCLRGDFHAQIIAHQHISEYINTHHCKIIFFSSANTFDAYSQYPSYELDKTLSGSTYGHFKIKIENMLLRLPKQKVVIVRLPMVLGSRSPRIKKLKQYIKTKTAIEVFPNVIINVTSVRKISQQIHYIINRNKLGIFHLGSVDLIHHDEFIQNLVKILSSISVTFKQVFTSNQDRYLAVLPKHNKLPKHLQLTSNEVLDELKK